MMPDQKRLVLDQLDSTLREFEALQSKSKYGDFSDRSNEATRVITLLAAAIARIAPPGSVYRSEADRILTRWGASNGQCLKHLPGIVLALRSDVESGFLQSVSELVHAQLFSDFIEMAEYLLAEDYREAAAVLVGGVLEEQLRKLAIKNGLPISTGARTIKADQLNADLARATVYSTLDQKNVTAWLDLRNKAAHARHTEYTKEQVVLMLSGVQNFAARLPA
jgi:hypothetical protein